MDISIPIDAFFHKAQQGQKGAHPPKTKTKTKIVIIRPPVRSNGRTYKMLVMFFFPARNLRDPSADHRETLSHDWKLVLFYNPTSKLSPKKFWGPKTCKISVHFAQLPTLIANISGTAQDIQNRKTN